MVSFSSSLPSVDVKKLTFPDQFLSSPRRKVFSPFGLGVLLSFVILTVALLNISSKGPIFNPVFQGLHSFGTFSNGSSLLSWPFSGGLKDSGSNLTLSGFNDTAAVQNIVASNESLGFVSSDGKNGTFGNTHFVGNQSEVKIDGRNGSDYVENPILADNSGKEADLGTARIENSVNTGKNESVSEEVYNSENSTVKYEDGKGGNSSSNGVNMDLRNNGTNGPAADKRSLKDCDIYNGRWVRDEMGPYYPPGSCPYIDKDFDCHLNGRPDDQYVKWRWQPNDCDIPRLNATDFLERLRGKKLVFVGDSLNRNMWESLVCALRHGVEDKNRVYEISGKHEFKKKGFYAFRFEDYDCSVDFVSSPFLVKESSHNGKNGSFETLRLDWMDSTTSMYHDADVIIFNTGHWWTHEKTSRGEDYYQEGNYVHPRLKVLEAYKRALYTWAKWVDKNIDTSKTEVIYRGYSVTHFRGGPWNSGGQCNNETEPIFNDNYLAKYPSKMKVLEYVLKDMKTPVTFLNISRLTDYRKDGHPSMYRPGYLAKQEVHAQDCSHWCLPGVPDTWNELLYVSLLKNGRGSWKD